jgi:hypothetical protein
MAKVARREAAMNDVDFMMFVILWIARKVLRDDGV